MRGGKPSATFAEDELAIAVLVDEAVKSDSEGAVVVAAVFPVAGSAPSLDRLRLGCWWVSGGSGEPRALCPGPHLPFYGAVRREPTNHGAVGRSRSGRRSKGG